MLRSRMLYYPALNQKSRLDHLYSDSQTPCLSIIVSTRHSFPSFHVFSVTTRRVPSPEPRSFLRRRIVRPSRPRCIHTRRFFLGSAVDELACACSGSDPGAGKSLNGSSPGVLPFGSLFGRCFLGWDVEGRLPVGARSGPFPFGSLCSRCFVGSRADKPARACSTDPDAALLRVSGSVSGALPFGAFFFRLLSRLQGESEGNVKE